MTIDRESLRPAFEAWASFGGRHPGAISRNSEGAYINVAVQWIAWCAAFESLGEPVAWLRDDELRRLGRPYSDAPINRRSDSMLVHAKGTPEAAAQFGHDVPVYRLPKVKA